MDFPAYDDAVGAIYAAAMAPERWPEAVRRIATGCGASRAILFTPLHGPQQGGFSHACNLPADRIEHWQSKAMHEDPFVEAIVRKGWFVSGMAVTGDQLVPRAQLLGTTFYREMWQPVGIVQVCAGIIFDGRDMLLPPVALSIYRGPGDPDFDEVDVEWVRRMVAHLARALTLMFHLCDLNRQVAANTAALERLAAGVVTLDAGGSVTYSNHAARQIFCRESHVILRRPPGQRLAMLALHPRLARQAKQFQAAIDESLNPGLGSLTSTSITDDTGRTVCVVHAAPVPTTGFLPALGVEGGSVVFLYDLESVAALPVTRLVDLYGLTPAEAGVALEIVRGGTSEAMAGRLHVSVNTVNTHLRNVYSKTSTHRQADLLKLLLALTVA